FENENQKDNNLLGQLNTISQEFKSLVKDRGELISELNLFNWSIDAFESVKILTEFQNADIVKERALMKTIRETQLKILKRNAFVDQLRCQLMYGLVLCCMRTRSSSNLSGESSPNPTSSNPKRRNRRCSKQPFILEESYIDTMADQRTMAKLLHATTKGYAEAIVVPLILVEQIQAQVQSH
nr:hypothetical protein [Tanacetum cinerariifolium]